MIRRNVLVFVLSSVIAFVAFSAVVLALQFFGMFTQTMSFNGQAQAWQAMNLTDYRMEVVSSSAWQGLTYTITVRDNQVVDYSSECLFTLFEGETCEIQQEDTADYTVSGLFDAAQNLMQHHAVGTITITYDSTYHFPTTLVYNDREIMDEEFSWRVVSFEPLSPIISADSQEQAWQSLGITHYRLTITSYKSGMIWGAHTYTVEVNNGEVTPITLICLDPSGCETLSIDLNDYTVESLFALTQDASHVEYDAMYHFPTLINGPIPVPMFSGQDSDQWTVTDFEPLN
jgi:hypothetical protein